MTEPGRDDARAGLGHRRRSPMRVLFPGRPTGSAMPLAWAHAEFVKLMVSRQLGHPSTGRAPSGSAIAGAGRRRNTRSGARMRRSATLPLARSWRSPARAGDRALGPRRLAGDRGHADERQRIGLPRRGARYRSAVARQLGRFHLARQDSGAWTGYDITVRVLAADPDGPVRDSGPGGPGALTRSAGIPDVR